MLTAVVEQRETKICGRCGLDKPLVQFRLRTAAGTLRHAECNLCHNQNMNRRNARLRSNNVKTFLVRASAETEWERILAVCNSAFARADGIGNFIKTMRQMVEQQPPDSPLRLRYFAAILNLYTAAESQRANPSLHTATEGDLLELWEYRLQQMVREEPAALLLAAEKLGCEVKWPEGSPWGAAVTADQ
jgi:hypothetical protein